jgi:hypothetical protein
MNKFVTHVSQMPEHIDARLCFISGLEIFMAACRVVSTASSLAPGISKLEAMRRELPSMLLK